MTSLNRLLLLQPWSAPLTHRMSLCLSRVGALRLLEGLCLGPERVSVGVHGAPWPGRDLGWETSPRSPHKAQ